jgi:hypothetical protein
LSPECSNKALICQLACRPEHPLGTTITGMGAVLPCKNINPATRIEPAASPQWMGQLTRSPAAAAVQGLGGMPVKQGLFESVLKGK